MGSAVFGGQVPGDFSEQWSELITLLDSHRQLNAREWFRSLVRHDRWRTSYWVLRQLHEWGHETMARGTRKPAVTKAAANKQWTTFVEISLAGHDMAKIEAEFSSPDALFDSLSNMFAAGYRISLSHNVQNDAIIASVTCKDDDSVNAGCTFTSFAGDWFTALKIAAYKHFVVTQENWIGVAGKTDRPMFG